MPTAPPARPSRGRAPVDILEQSFRIERVRDLLAAGETPRRLGYGWVIGSGPASTTCSDAVLRAARKPVQEEMPE